MATKTKRWWLYQLVAMLDENNETVYVLKEVFWKQAGNRKPKIWFYQDPQIAEISPKDACKLLQTIIESIKKEEIVSYKDLPSEKTMQKEYEKVAMEE